MTALLVLAALIAFAVGFFVGMLMMAGAIVYARGVRRRRARQGGLRVVGGGRR